MGADEFVIKASVNKALFGFGDAVCVPVISWIAGHYLNPLLEAYNRIIDECETDPSLKITVG